MAILCYSYRTYHPHAPQVTAGSSRGCVLGSGGLPAAEGCVGRTKPPLHKSPSTTKETRPQPRAPQVTTGSSRGCTFGGGGWPAAEGWDAVTGVGTPNYAALLKVVMALP